MRCPKSPLWGLSTSREQMSKQGQECRNPAQATNKHAARLPPPRWMCRAEAVTPFSSWGGCRRRETTQLEASGAGKVPAQHSGTRLQWLLQEGEILEVSEQMRARFVWRSQNIGPIGGGGRRRSAVCFGLFCVLFYFIFLLNLSKHSEGSCLCPALCSLARAEPGGSCSWLSPETCSEGSDCPPVLWISPRIYPGPVPAPLFHGGNSKLVSSVIKS